MKTYIIEWGTDYCENFQELIGTAEIKANSEDEAAVKFHSQRIPKANIYRIYEKEN